MTALLVTVFLTLLVSAFCSLLEAMLLSTTGVEIEALKEKSPQRGRLLEQLCQRVEKTNSAILSLNTLANTAGATLSGALALSALGESNVKYFSLALVFGILIFSEIIPKNLGVLYRPSLQPVLVRPLRLICYLMAPISALCDFFVRGLSNGKSRQRHGADEEILLLTKRGTLSRSESAIITNALKLDEAKVSEMMTPRTVITALRAEETVGEVFEKTPNIPFARLPLYKDTLDDIVGMARRRDLLKAKANDKDTLPIKELASEACFIPENATGEQALETLLRQHQQMAVVVNEFGSVAGLLSMEDIMESILGREIFEKDDVAIDMREFARHKKRLEKQRLEELS